MKTLTITLCVAALFLGFAVWLLPFSIPTDPALAGTDVGLGLAISAMYTLLNIITVGLFFAGLRNFKTTLRRPYIILCIGLVTIALAQVQIPLAIVLDAAWWITSGALLFLYIVPNVLIYSGIRLFARLVGVKGRWTLYRFAMPLVLVPVVVSFVVPISVPSITQDPLAAHFFVALPLWQMGVNVVCAYLVWRVKQTMGGVYASAMHWLFVSMVAYMAISAHFVVILYLGYSATWYGQNGIMAVFVVLGLLFVVAGYKFAQIGVRHAVQEDASSLDVVTYTASLATNKDDIDPILDKVRSLTAKMTPGQPLTPDDEKTLGTVYLELEDYLVEREPLRKFTRENVRQQVIDRFRSSEPRNSSFWDTIVADKIASGS